MMILADLKTKIEFEKLKEFLVLLPAIAIGEFLVVLIFCIGLISVLPTDYLWAWIGVVLIMSVLKIFLISAFKQYEHCAEKNIQYWRLLIVASCSLSGISWGAGSFIAYGLIPDSYHMYIFTVLVAIVSCYFPILVHYDRCFYAFLIPALTPAIYILATATQPGMFYMAFMLSMYLCLMLIFAKWFYSREFDRIRLRHSLCEQNEKVKEANDSKSLFLAAASHDLRQPLQALGFYIVMLSDFLREPHKKALFDKTLRAYQALDDLLNQLLNISKLNANLIEIINTNFSVEELFDKLKNDYELQALDKELNIRFFNENHFAYSDIVSVERILRNLIENALRYTEAGGEIQVSCIAENKRLKFQVSDTGIGISNEHLDKIFGEFYQIKNPERDRSKGFGLGLYAVDRLAKLLDSEIKVESQLNEGSVFWFTLSTGEMPKTVELNSGDAIMRNAILQDKVILIVDDDAVVLDSLCRLLLKWKCQVLTATLFQEAIDLIVDEEIVPELLIVDYRLPHHQTGVNLVQAIRAQTGEDIPVIVLTGDTGEESLTDINNSGLPFLHKPADPEKLRKMAMHLLSDNN